jgi:hypothetical protein
MQQSLDRNQVFTADDPIRQGLRFMPAQTHYHIPGQQGYQQRRTQFARTFQEDYPYYDPSANDPQYVPRSYFYKNQDEQKAYRDQLLAASQANPALIHRQAMGLAPTAGSLLSQKATGSGNLKDLVNTNKIDFATPNDPSALLAPPATADTRAFKERRTRVNIDSRDRDQSVWPKPNHYQVTLSRPFTNIKRVTIVSSEIPNTEQLVRATPPTRANNRIFWQNEDDGNVVYVASVSPGNYDAQTFQAEIQTQMNAVKRTGTNNPHEFIVSIDSVSEICTFSQAKTSYILTPFSCSAGSSLITVNHPNHGFADKQKVTVKNAVAFGGINQAWINREQVISVVDVNTYTFEIGAEPTMNAVNGGGNSVNVSFGLKFKLLFAEEGTVASLLGFERKDTEFGLLHSNTSIVNTVNIESIIPGMSNLATIRTQVMHGLTTGARVYMEQVVGTDSDNVLNDPAGYICTILDAYRFTIPVFLVQRANPDTGIVVIRTLTQPVNLQPQSYILLTSPILGVMANTGVVRNIFAKIQLAGPVGTTMYNSHNASPVVFEEAFLPLLEKVEFKFVTDKNELYEFNSVDHSFTIEIVELLDVVAASGFDSRRGAITET